MKWLRCLMITLAAIYLTVGLVGCSDKSGDSSSFSIFHKKPQRTTLNFYFPRNGVRIYIDNVVKEIEKRTADQLNIKLNINWIDWAPYPNYETEIDKLLKSGEKIDAYFDSCKTVAKYPDIYASKVNDWMDISSLFPDYAPDLFSYYTGNELAPLTYKGKLMGIPGKNYDSSRQYVVVRGDIMKKYGIKDIKTLEDYGNYLKIVAKNEKNLDYLIMNQISLVDAYMESKGYLHYDLDTYFYRYDPQCKLIPIENIPEYTYVVNVLRSWVKDGYISSNVYPSNNSTPENFNSYTGYYDSATIYSEESSVPTRVYPLYPDTIFTKTIIPGTAVYFSSRSKDVKTSLKLLNWFFKSKKNHDLITYGLEGVNYKLENGKVKLLVDDDNYGESYYSMSSDFSGFFHNLDLERPFLGQSADYLKKYKESFDHLNRYVPLSSFYSTNSNREILQDLLHDLNIKVNELYNGFLQDDYPQIFEEYLSLKKQMGRDNLIEQEQKEIDNWLKTRK